MCFLVNCWLDGDVDVVVIVLFALNCIVSYSDARYLNKIDKLRVAKSLKTTNIIYITWPWHFHSVIWGRRPIYLNVCHSTLSILLTIMSRSLALYVGCVRSLYFTKVRLGTPPREYNVQIDTGSDILWVSCSSCDDCPRTSGLGVTYFSFILFLRLYL